MEISFTGDICFGDVDKFTRTPFKNISDRLSHLNCVVNLEAPFLPRSYGEYPIKPKVCLRSFDDSIDHLKQIKPFLVNLANNHINDFGNFGAENTKHILDQNRFKFLGAGLPNEDHNIFVVEEKKIVFLSYVTRSIDLSGSKLFEDEGFIGPKEYSFSLVQKQISPYSNYIKVVLFHWGIEDIHYPTPEQVEIGRKLIDAGFDLVIGNHPHVIQSYEQYKGKWIFYCLGHLYFPHFESKYLNKKGTEHIFWDYHKKNRRISIIPVFKIDEQEIKLNEILTIKTEENFEPYFVNTSPKYNTFLFKNILLYRIFYSLRKRIVYLYHLPSRFVRRIKRLIQNNK